MTGEECFLGKFVGFPGKCKDWIFDYRSSSKKGQFGSRVEYGNFFALEYFCSGSVKIKKKKSRVVGECD